MSLLALLAPPKKDPPPEMAEPLSWKFLLGVAGVVFGALIASIDERLASAAQSDLVGGFGTGQDPGSWISTAYDVGQVIVLPVAPWLGAVLSVRRVAAFLLALGTLAACACSDAHSYQSLLFFRLLQGIGNGGMLPMMLSTMLTIVPPNRKGAALTIYALTVVLASAISQSVEGVATDLFVWRSVFWTSLALAPFAIFLILACMPVTPPQWEKFAGADYFGILTLTLSCGCLTAGLGQGQRLDWFDSGFIVAMFFLAVWFLVVFVANEIAIDKPLYPLSTFAKPTFVAGVTIIFFAAMSLLSATFLFPQEQELIRQLRPLQIGNVLLWLVIPATLSAACTAVLLRLVDARLVMATGFTLIIGGIWSCVWITPVWDGDDAQLFLQLEAIGWVMAIAANAMVTSGALGPEDSVTGPVAFNLLRTFGFLAGSAILGGILQVRTRVHSDEAIAAHLDIARQPVRERLATGGLAALDHAQTLQATVMAIADCFGWLAIFSVLALPLILLQHASPVIRRRPA